MNASCRTHDKREVNSVSTCVEGIRVCTSVATPKIQRWRQHMGWWLRFVGFWKWYVFLAKEPCKRDDILQKRPMILRSLLIVTTPYQRLDSFVNTWEYIDMSHTFIHPHELSRNELRHMCDMTHSCVRHDTSTCATWRHDMYDLATISRPLTITRLFYTRALWKRRYFAKETYNSKEPTNPTWWHVGISYLWMCLLKIIRLCCRISSLS